MDYNIEDRFADMTRQQLEAAAYELQAEVVRLQELKDVQLAKLALVTEMNTESEALWSDYVTTDDSLSVVEDNLSAADGVYAANFIY